MTVSAVFQLLVFFVVIKYFLRGVMQIIDTTSYQRDAHHFENPVELISKIDCKIQAYEQKKGLFKELKEDLLNALVDYRNDLDANRKKIDAERIQKKEKAIISERQASMYNSASMVLSAVGAGAVFFTPVVGLPLLALGAASKFFSNQESNNAASIKHALDQAMYSNFCNDDYDSYLDGSRKKEIEDSTLERLVFNHSRAEKIGLKCKPNLNPAYAIAKIDGKINKLNELKVLLCADLIKNLPAELITEIFHQHHASALMPS